MTNSRRERGFYWIRLKTDDFLAPSPWTIGEWDGHGWIVAQFVNPVPPDLVAIVEEVTLRSPVQRYTRMVPEPMRSMPGRTPMAIQEALRKLEIVMDGRKTHAVS